jgi:hypothetical protein
MSVLFFLLLGFWIVGYALTEGRFFIDAFSGSRRERRVNERKDLYLKTPQGELLEGYKAASIVRAVLTADLAIVLILAFISELHN